MTGALVIASITGQLTSWIGHHGAYAVLAIMALDALLPVGGELTMLYAGALAAGAIAGQHPILLGHQLSTGLESYVVLALAGTIGYLIGSLVGWGIGRWGERWLRVSSETLDRAEQWFHRHGRTAVFLGRLTPVVRSFISIPAGVFDTPLAPYTVLTLAGSAVWCFGFAGAGWALGSSYERVHHAFGYVDVVVVVAAVATLVALLALHRRQRARA